MSTADVDFERFRLRALVEELTRLGEVEVHDEPVALADLSSVIEASDKAVLFRNAGPEKLELVAGVMGSRRRLAVALGVDERDSLREYERRLATPQAHFEVPSADAPVHQVVLTGDDIDLTKLPFYLQHDLDGGPYISSAIDFSVDPASGRRNVGCRRLMLRGRRHLRTNLTAPSDLKLAYRAAVERGERFPISFAIGSHPTALAFPVPTPIPRSPRTGRSPRWASTPPPGCPGSRWSSGARRRRGSAGSAGPAASARPCKAGRCTSARSWTRSAVTTAGRWPSSLTSFARRAR
jgi:3-polyprenyl-4-hydroxybenzoate decarboxylase